MMYVSLQFLQSAWALLGTVHYTWGLAILSIPLCFFDGIVSMMSLCPHLEPVEVSLPEVSILMMPMLSEPKSGIVVLGYD
jgi:hypothetical protein